MSQLSTRLDIDKNVQMKEKIMRYLEEQQYSNEDIFVMEKWVTDSQITQNILIKDKKTINLLLKNFILIILILETLNKE